VLGSVYGHVDFGHKMAQCAKRKAFTAGDRRDCGETSVAPVGQLQRVVRRYLLRISGPLLSLFHSLHLDLRTCNNGLNDGHIAFAPL